MQHGGVETMPHAMPPAMTGGHVAIVGAGFSGSMLAVHLARRGVAVTLIDGGGLFAAGLAYGAAGPMHVLNVRAGNMSAFPDEPNHFASWLAARGEGDAATFARRMTYRDYLAQIVEDCGNSILQVRDEVVAIVDGRPRLRSGSEIDCDAIVIAAGNLPPAPFARMAEAGVPYVEDPWTADGRRGIADLAGRSGDVLILGTGLTMVDTVLSLRSQGFAGRIVATSRRGLLPRAHADGAVPPVGQPDKRRPRALLRWVRARSVSGDWRGAVDALRPITAAIWQGWSHAERGRFLRHLRPWWDVHRHRIAPEVARALDGMIAGGRLSVHAARVEDVKPGSIALRLRGGSEILDVAVAGIVNCTGPQGDLRRSGNPLIRNLLESGTAIADAFGLGLKVDDSSRIVDARGVVSDNIFAVGPMTRGRHWEMVAVPDIRVQLQRLAQQIVENPPSRHVSASLSFSVSS